MLYEDLEPYVSSLKFIPQGLFIPTGAVCKATANNYLSCDGCKFRDNLKNMCKINALSYEENLKLTTKFKKHYPEYFI